MCLTVKMLKWGCRGLSPLPGRGVSPFGVNLRGAGSSLPGFQEWPWRSFSLLAAAGGEQKEKKKFFGDTPNPGKGRLPFAIPLNNREVDAKGGHPRAPAGGEAPWNPALSS